MNVSAADDDDETSVSRNQGTRNQQRDLQEMRERFEQMRKREAETNEKLSIERARCKTMETEIGRRRKQVEDSTTQIRKLQYDLESARRAANGVNWDLRENEIKSMADAEIARLKSQISGLEARLNRKQIELESAHELVRNSTDSAKRKVEEMRKRLDEKDKTLQKCLDELSEKSSSTSTVIADREYLEGLNQQIGSLTANNDNLRSRVDELQAEKLELASKLRFSEEDRTMLQLQVNTLKEQLSDSEGSVQRASSHLSEEVDRIKQQKAQLRCEHIQLKREHTKLENEIKLLNEKLEEYGSIESQMKELRLAVNSLENQKQEIHAENTSLRVRLEQKETFYEQKLVESERLTKKNQDNESAQIKRLTVELDTSKKKMENMRKAMTELDSQCEDLMAKLRSATATNKSEENSTISDLRKRECELINENTQLRQGFAELLAKTEKYRDLSTESQANLERLKVDLKEKEEKLLNMEDQILELKGELEQKEKLVSYLQSVVLPKQMQKLPQEKSLLQSSLISSGSDIFSDISMEYRQCQELEQKRDELQTCLKNKRKVLSEMQSEAVPLIKGTQLTTEKDDTMTCSSGTPRLLPVMRHDIPHRWRKQFITVLQARCSICQEGLPHFGHVFKCRDCPSVAHSHCRDLCPNYCGLPAVCADLFDSQSSVGGSERMTGWVRLWSASEPSSGKWRNVWATIDEHRLSFFDSENLAESNGAPFFKIDLAREHWRIFNQTTVDKPVSGVTNTEMSMLIEVKMPSITLFMLAPTVQAKQRWVQALQHATSRRIFAQRRSSIVEPSLVGNSLLLALDRPLNLSINCTQIFDSDWLLMGAQEGLFATNLHNPRAPFNIAGVSKIFWMELIPQYEMLLCICGVQRQFGVVHLQQLKRAVQAEQQPFVQFTPIANIENCHLAVVSKPDHIENERFVYLATMDEITIMHYVRKLGVFIAVKRFQTAEPCMCICSTPSGFIFGADNFHFVRYDTPTEEFSFASQLAIDNCPIDFPIAALEITPSEYLLAFHNYGVFVSIDGKRTRKENVEWERVPLEFVYTAPYLYIVYCEFMEVVRVAAFTGLDSPTLTDDRSMFKCRSAHRTGFGTRRSDVIFAVSAENRVELHVFNHSETDTQAGKSVLKRKINDTLTRSVQQKKKY